MTEAKAVPLSKLKKGEIADKWGALKSRADAIEEEIAELKAEFDRRGLSVAEGVNFLVAKSGYTFDGLDIPAIRAEMGPAWCEKRSKPMARTTYKVSPL